MSDGAAVLQYYVLTRPPSGLYNIIRIQERCHDR
jgi:hypothetical protein